jgi:hypothetical protein
MDWLNIQISISALALMAYVDRVSFGTWLTPVTILGVPYLSIAVIAFIFGPALDYLPIYTPSVVIWIAFLFLFWICGRLVPGAVGYRSAPIVFDWDCEERSVRRTALTLALLTIPVSLYAALSAGAGSGALADYRDTSYQRAASGGVAGHILTLSFPLMIYLIGTASRKRLLNVFVVGTLLALLFLRPSKWWIIFPLTAALLYRASTNKSGIQLRSFIWLIVAAFCVFNIAYFINLSAADTSIFTEFDTYTFLWRHTLDYLFSGPLAFSEMVKAGAHCLDKPAAVYAPFMNVYALISGGAMVDPNETQFTTIRVANEGWSANVHTLFGGLISTVGYLQSVLYCAALGIVSYFLFHISRSGRDVWLAILWCFWATALGFAWFSIYFANLSLFEVPAYCVLLFLWNNVTRSRLDHEHARAT